MKKNLALAGSALFCALALLPAATLAATPAVPSLPVQLRPSTAQGAPIPGASYFTFTAHAGGVVHADAFVSNPGSKRAAISVVPVGATSGEFGSVSYDLSTNPRRGVGTWIAIPRTTFNLPKDQGTVVPVTIRVPRRAKPGQYIGAITAYVPATMKHISKRFGLTVQTRVFSAVVITIPGPTHARLQVRGVAPEWQSGRVIAAVNIKNTGGVLLRGHGQLWVYTAHGHKPWISKSFTIQTTVPHTGIHFPIPWAKSVPRGQYRYAAKVWWDAASFSLQASGLGAHPSSGSSLVRGWFQVR